MLESLEKDAAGIVKYINDKDIIANTNKIVLMILNITGEQKEEIKVKVDNMVILMSSKTKLLGLYIEDSQ